MGFLSHNTVHRHETGSRKPDVDQISKYAEVTDGAVTYDDWQRLSRSLASDPAGHLPTQAEITT